MSDGGRWVRQQSDRNEAVPREWQPVEKIVHWRLSSNHSQGARSALIFGLPDLVFALRRTGSQLLFLLHVRLSLPLLVRRQLFRA